MRSRLMGNPSVHGPLYSLIGRPLLYISWLAGLVVFLGGIASLSKGDWVLGLLAPVGLAVVLGGFFFGVIWMGELQLWVRHTIVNSATGLAMVFIVIGGLMLWSHDWWGLISVVVGLPLFAMGFYFGLAEPPTRSLSISGNEGPFNRDA
jgi:hypothetical protein